jgi:hypothetical protein
MRTSVMALGACPAAHKPQDKHKEVWVVEQSVMVPFSPNMLCATYSQLTHSML